MKRLPEPELMDDAAQAEAYAVADFAEVNQAFVDRFRQTFLSFSKGRVLDLGCGPADIPIRLVQALPSVRVTAVDGSASMLKEAARAIEKAGVGEAIELRQAVLPQPKWEAFDAVLSNSLLHHLHEPSVLWDAVREAAEPGAPVLVMDLVRPPSEEDAQKIVDTYAADERPVLKEDFYNSLRAAFSLDEVRAQLEQAGLGQLSVEQVSDRHLTVHGHR